MDKKTILVVLLKAKETFLAQKHGTGLCYHIDMALCFYCSHVFGNYYEHSEFIPEFNSDYAEEYFDAKVSWCNYWWPISDRESRINYLNHLIEIYSK